jgi:predicted enzyme related to lactoylglutathione lyase
MYESVINWFEIPVADMDRAVAFYEPVMQVTLRREKMDCAELAVFPHEDPATGGALANLTALHRLSRALLFTCILTIWHTLDRVLRAASACLARWNCRMILAPSRCLPTARVTASASINLPES